MSGLFSLMVIGYMGTKTNHDGPGGRAMSNVVYSCEGRGWSLSIGGVVRVSGSGARLAALQHGCVAKVENCPQNLSKKYRYTVQLHLHVRIVRNAFGLLFHNVSFPYLWK